MVRIFTVTVQCPVQCLAAAAAGAAAAWRQPTSASNAICSRFTAPVASFDRTLRARAHCPMLTFEPSASSDGCAVCYWPLRSPPTDPLCNIICRLGPICPTF